MLSIINLVYSSFKYYLYQLEMEIDAGVNFGSNGERGDPFCRCPNLHMDILFHRYPNLHTEILFHRCPNLHCNLVPQYQGGAVENLRRHQIDILAEWIDSSIRVPPFHATTQYEPSKNNHAAC